jgi:hypothetical protein
MHSIASFFSFLSSIFTFDLTAQHSTTLLSAPTGLRDAADSILPNSVSSGETARVAVHLPHSKVKDLH